LLEFSSDQPLLVFGGPYSNLRATEAMRAEAERLALPPSRVICTGDVVAYCAEPEETARLVRKWGIHVVAGNCEEQLAAGASDCGCGFEEGSLCDLLAKGWYPFADQRVTPDSRAWMAGLPRTLWFRFHGLRFRVIHGGVNQINRFLFASEKTALAEELAKASADVVIAGHAGVPFIERFGGGVWFNPGVIGMPANDGTPETWYGLMRAEPGVVRLSLRRLAYDHLSAAAAMRRSGHGNGYARCLVTGHWPSLDILPPAERAATGVRLRRKTLSIAAAGVSTELRGKYDI
jgi:predicted phosphodiesterase